MRKGPATKRRVLKAIEITEIASVDNPAQAGARQVLMKRDDDDALAKAAMLTTAYDGHTHLVNTSSYNGEATSGDTSGADTSSGQYHTHPWVSSEDDAGDDVITIGTNLGHTHGMGTMSKRDKPAGGANAPAPATTSRGETPASALGKSQSDAGESAAEGTSEGTTMTDAKSAAAEAVTADKLKAAETKTEELSGQLAKALRLAEMTDAEKAFAKALANDAERDAFYAATPESRAGNLAKAKDANPVVFTSADGTEFRKSDDARFVKQARLADELAKSLADERSEKQTMLLKRQADTDLRHLSGDDDTKVALLKAVSTIADPALRAKCVATLKASNEGMAKAHVTLGTTTPASGGLTSAMAMAKAQAEKDGISEEMALLKLMEKSKSNQALALERGA